MSAFAAHKKGEAELTNNPAHWFPSVAFVQRREFRIAQAARKLLPDAATRASLRMTRHATRATTNRPCSLIRT
jgi:hypothetical protein